MVYLRVTDFWITILFLCKRYFHCVRRCDLEALQSLFGGTALQFSWELNKRNVVAIRYQSNLFKSRELIEQHRQHHFVGFFGKISQEQDLIGWLFGGAGVWYARLSICRWLLLLLAKKSIKWYEDSVKMNSGLDFYRFSSVSTGFGGLIFFGRSLKVPLIFAITSLSDLQYEIRIGLS